MHRSLQLAVAAAAVILIGSISGSAASPAPSLTRQQLAQKILDSPAGKYFTAPARAALEGIARGDHRLAPGTAGADISKAAKITAGHGQGGTALPNVRVNNPALDTNQVDQTTQSETSVAVSGSNVVVGYNSSRHALLLLTAGADLSGVAYSSDGGQTFTDGGVLPNAPGNVNVGDPWLASDSGGTFYYSTLAFTQPNLNFGVAVGRSTDGGKTWSGAATIPPPANEFIADKDALTAGPGSGNLYDVWDDVTFDPTTGEVDSGLPVAHTTDGGQSWTIAFASKVALFAPPPPPPAPPDCSSRQYIGAQPLAAGGTIYDVAELITFSNPSCVFPPPPPTFSEAVFSSADGGATWKAGAVIPITSSTSQASGVFQLGPGQLMRNLEFPTVAAFNGKLYVAWNDGGDGSGHSHIRLAVSSDGGQTFSTSFVTSGTNDEAQPAMSADTALHIAYYQISTDASGNGQLDVFVSNSNSGGTRFRVQRVTGQSFPGVFTFPQFDPIIAFAYMGDYIANVSDGSHQYMAWGDNRDIVTNFLWPNGRHDPDVFFAKQ